LDAKLGSATASCRAPKRVAPAQRISLRETAIQPLAAGRRTVIPWAEKYLHGGAQLAKGKIMRWSWRIGRLAGIAIYVHATFLLLILFILYMNWHQGKSLATAMEGILFILAIFGCIVLHELGHALAARRYGIRTRDITLLPIGGLARLERMPDIPIQELWVALAGPAVNAVIAAGLLGFGFLLGVRPELASFRWAGGSFLNKLMAVNFWLLAFNLIPAFPMDGGRVLRALLATRLEYSRATLAAARVAQTIAFFFGLAGLFTDPFLVFIALFVWMGAEQESAMVQMHNLLGGIPVQQAMLTNFRTVQPDDPLAKAVEHALEGWQQDFPVVFGDHVMGMLTRDNLTRALAQGGIGGPVRAAMNRDFVTVDSHEMLEKALATIRAAKCRSVPVLHDGVLVGLLTMDHVGELLTIHTALRQSQRATRLAPRN
jgi:Zn-dependent protease/CBS domain-containing protein